MTVPPSFTGPRFYDECLGPLTFGPFAELLAQRLPPLARGPVLEIACGTGVLTAPLRRRLPAAVELVATDLSTAMLEYARARLKEQIETLVQASPALDPDRLHQEAVMLATRADIREEIDRLTAHVAAARALLAESGPVGRRLDFLAQEFNREANTLCAKANDWELTTIGLELKALVDQFREQVQNLE